MRVFIFSCLSLLFLFPTLANAVVGNDFAIRVAAGEDIIAPSTPNLLSVSPIASTQIDLVWSTSTDNWIFGGYVVERNGVPIATTTLTNYSDTGLIPLTIYDYTVYAFDAAGNISTISNTLSTTTLAVPIVATSTPQTATTSQTSGTLIVQLRNFSLQTSETSAVLAWETNIPSRYTLRWGRTDAYTGGYIENESFQVSQQTVINELEPGTVYLFELIGYTPAGRALTLKKGQFSTTEQEKNRVVANVERLIATVVGNDVTLQYKLPVTELGARVKVVRSHLGFPVDLYDGAIIYEGASTKIEDKEVLKNYRNQYYTVFVIGADGSISSGAVVMVERVERSNSNLSSTTKISDNSKVSGIGLPENEPEILLPLLTVNQIEIIQGERRMTFLDDWLELSYLSPFTISIVKTALPEHLKSIIVTLLDPTDQRRSYSFLLRINKTGTAYEATVSALGVIGTSRLQVEVFDFEQLVVGRYLKQIDFVSLEKTIETVIFPDALINSLQTALPMFISLFGLIIIIWLFMWRRRRQTEDKQ